MCIRDSLYTCVISVEAQVRIMHLQYTCVISAAAQVRIMHFLSTRVISAAAQVSIIHVLSTRVISSAAQVRIRHVLSTRFISAASSQSTLQLRSRTLRCNCMTATLAQAMRAAKEMFFALRIYRSRLSYKTKAIRRGISCASKAISIKHLGLSISNTSSTIERARLRLG